MYYSAFFNLTSTKNAGALLKTIIITIMAISFFATIGCFENKNKVEDKFGLSSEKSVARKKAISNVSYDIEIDISKAQNESIYSGRVQLDFNYSGAKEIDIDFAEGKVLKVSANGNELDPKKVYTKYRIKLDPKVLKEGVNSVSVHFEQNFSKTGSGFYRFKDLQDDKVYLYTDFEPYDANRFAPLFDQPNLKATYKLKVKAPLDWQVISSKKETGVSKKEEWSEWSFPESKKFSTYIFSLHAGPYKVWEKTAKVNDKKIPMRLFARLSLAKFVKPDFWFEITESGFNFFESYYSTPYPYYKYDQVLVPDFNSGAMENVASVTFNEFFVSREKKPSRSSRRGLANTILHEMAHMWFGNLVTMNWWNDLWLNESFATYSAYVASHEATKFKESWLSFFVRTKQWSYSEDQWRTTHPIEAKIPNTNVATSNFDGITYGKGASSLKQLVFLIGEDNFKKGLKDYFTKYAEKNTELKDFMGSLQNYTKEDLSQWTEFWLRSAGLNGIAATPVCEKGSLKSVSFVQSIVSGDEKMRPHKTKVALWTENKITSEPDHIFELRYSENKKVWKPEKKDMSCPKAIYPNWEDHDYVSVTLDTKTLEQAMTDLGDVKDDLFRAQLWSSLWEMFKFGKIKPSVMHELLIKNLEKEKEQTVLSGAVYNLTPLYYYLGDQEKLAMVEKLKSLTVSSTDLDNKKTFFEAWLDLADKNSMKDIQSCLSGCNFEAGVEISPDRRWSIVKKLAALRWPDTPKLLKSELEEDNGRRAQLSALSAEVLFADQDEKANWVKKALTDKELKLQDKFYILGAIGSTDQREENLNLKAKTFKLYSKELVDLLTRLQRSFAYTFAPYYCGDLEVDEPLTEKMIDKSEWSFGVKKALKQRLDVEERCLKIKDLAVN